MSNMSYCRFRNTAGDLTDCLYAIEDGDSSISHEEVLAGKRMFREFLNFCENMGIIEGWDTDALSEMFDRAKGD